MTQMPRGAVATLVSPQRRWGPPCPAELFTRRSGTAPRLGGTSPSIPRSAFSFHQMQGMVYSPGKKKKKQTKKESSVEKSGRAQFFL